MKVKICFYHNELMERCDRNTPRSGEAVSQSHLKDNSSSLEHEFAAKVASLCKAVRGSGCECELRVVAHHSPGDLRYQASLCEGWKCITEQDVVGRKDGDRDWKYCLVAANSMLEAPKPGGHGFDMLCPVASLSAEIYKLAEAFYGVLKDIYTKDAGRHYNVPVANATVPVVWARGCCYQATPDDDGQKQDAMRKQPIYRDRVATAYSYLPRRDSGLGSSFSYATGNSYHRGDGGSGYSGTLEEDGDPGESCELSSPNDKLNEVRNYRFLQVEVAH